MESSKTFRDNQNNLLLGVDLGGTKIAAIALGASGEVGSSARVASPRNNYQASLTAIRDLLNQVGEQCKLDRGHPVGVGAPGSINPQSGLMQNANSTWLNERPLLRDLEEVLQRPVRLANDANCFALSESHDGAAEGARSVFGVILGTGCGGGLAIDGKIIDGPRGIGGEWGHNPLPWPTESEIPGPQCWCGQFGCMETWISGSGLEADYLRASGKARKTPEILALAKTDKEARAAIDNHCSRLARGLATVVNLFDPEVIVLGGGLSAMPHLYKELAEKMARFIFSTNKIVDIRPPIHGDASGVRGAARLWRDGAK